MSGALPSPFRRVVPEWAAVLTVGYRGRIVGLSKETER